MNIKYIWLLIILIGFTACNDDDDSSGNVDKVELVPGTADFSTFVSVGSSLTAGYTDLALFKNSQENSLPNIIAQKMEMAGGGDFSQPLTDDNIGGLLLGGNVIQAPRLYFDGSGPAELPGVPTTEVSNIKPGPYNNMGVPGAKALHLLAPGYGNLAGLPSLANPYFVRMASSPGASIIGDAMSQNPTFFTLWTGSMDILGHATSGADGSSPITDQPTFEFAYGTLISTLTSGGADGVIANIPDITSIPHFTAVPYNPLDPSNPDFGPLIPTLNATFAQLNMAFAYLGESDRAVVFSETAASPVVIHDESLRNITAELFAVLQGGGLDPLTAGLLANQYGQSRQATADDLLVLPSANVIATVNVEYFTQLVSAGVPQETAGQLSVNGITYPLQDKWVLLPSEQLEIKTATDSFNTVIKNAADQAGLAFVDANAIMREMASTGFASGNFVLEADLVTGGAFSLDGVHPTARGYALMANEFLKAIDATYGSNFEASETLVDIGKYPTNYSPLLQ